MDLLAGRPHAPHMMREALPNLAETAELGWGAPGAGVAQATAPGTAAPFRSPTRLPACGLGCFSNPNKESWTPDTLPSPGTCGSEPWPWPFSAPPSLPRAGAQDAGLRSVPAAPLRGSVARAPWRLHFFDLGGSRGGCVIQSLHPGKPRVLGRTRTPPSDSRGGRWRAAGRTLTGRRRSCGPAACSAPCTASAGPSWSSTPWGRFPFPGLPTPPAFSTAWRTLRCRCPGF